jgi:hypothetical protein
MFMVDLHSILQEHRPQNLGRSVSDSKKMPALPTPSYSEIPDIFFDTILTSYKLTRIETIVLMYLYRKVWCRPNLYRIYGISQLMSLTEMAKTLNVLIDDVYSSLLKLEELGFISTVRSGQYFVRKFFLKDYDEYYAQTYDDFEI